MTNKQYKGGFSIILMIVILMLSLNIIVLDMRVANLTGMIDELVETLYPAQ